MFPMLCEESKDLVPEVYFGLEGVPPYYHLRVDTVVDAETLASSIRSIGSGSECSGYIDCEGIHFHLPDDGPIRLDMSKEFVFVSQPNDVDGMTLSSWQILYFLQEPVRRVLLVMAHQSVLIEKTQPTLNLCSVLDQLWAREAFAEAKNEMIESEEAREKALARLMKVYEEEALGTSSEMWEFWETFGGLLMMERLGLVIKTNCQLTMDN
jgi:hypothetical protein